MGFVNCGGLCKKWDIEPTCVKTQTLFCFFQHHRRRFLIYLNLIIKVIQISTSTSDIVSVKGRVHKKNGKSVVFAKPPPFLGHF